jgi:uncharacterized protein (DUF362 family)/Pyruvate/2-oxoacid:ferredoxin oxidoreductase delta subunit
MHDKPVVFARCGAYDVPALTEQLKNAFSALGAGEEFFRGKRVLLKPNLVLAKKPDQAATTHPATVGALADVLFGFGAESVTLADSPGGPFSAAALNHVYKVCGMEGADPRIKLNDDFTFRPVITDGVKLKNLHMIAPFFDADVIVDVCKFKSHSLTGMSCAVKNFFGLIPGLEKFEMHSAFPELPDFSEMLVDLCSLVMREKPVLAVCDGILSMEGNGPTHGNPVETGFLLVSRDPFALDITAEHMMRRDGEVLYLNAAAQRGIVPRDWRQIPLLTAAGEPLPEPPTFALAHPDADAGHFLRNLPNFMGGRFTKLFEPRPEILKNKCVGCGKCADSCPRKTIEMVTKGKKRRAKIHRDKCIRCYCCQELCPIGAVGIHQNIIIKLIH